MTHQPYRTVVNHDALYFVAEIPAVAKKAAPDLTMAD